jgi:hypothetical protein
MAIQHGSEDAVVDNSEILRAWTAPTAQIHSIDIVQNVTGNFLHAADGGGSPCRS